MQSTIPEYHTARPEELREVKRSLIKPAYTIFLRTGAACNIGCITCPAGRKEPEERQPGALMKPDTLRAIVNRVHSQNCKVIQMAYHYYNEPMLNPDIAELVYIGEQEFDIRGTLSS